MATITHIKTPDGVIHDVGGGGGSSTYTLTKSGSTITLTGSGGDVSSVVDSNTTYSISISGHTITLTPSSGTAQTVTVPDDNTTYTISVSGSTITLTPSSGSAQTITIPDATTSASGVMSASDKSKLNGIESGAEVNVQSDWNQSDSTADDYIKNKPSIPTVSVTQKVSTGTNIADITVSGTTTQLYAPSGGGGGLSFDDIYPVGSIYMSVNNVNPGILFGGTWEQIQDSFLLSAGTTYTAGSTGGSATHTLTKNQLPVVSGSFNLRRVDETNHIARYPTGIVTRSDNLTDEARTVAWASSATNYPTDKISISFGAGQAHNNMPPYLVVYMWKRIPDPLIDYLVDENGNFLVDENGNYIEVV